MTRRFTEAQRWTMASGSALGLIFLVGGEWRTTVGILLLTALITLLLPGRLRR